MPAFDLRGIHAAQYSQSGGTVSYGAPFFVGDAMNVNLELRFAEGRLYAESTLAEYIRKALGGTISIGVKYIPSAAQGILFGRGTRSRTISGSPVSSLATTARDKANPVGVSFYAPDMVDGVEKYTCVFASRAMFGPPSMTFQTLNESITFQTPTTTGEIMADHSAQQNLFEVAVVDDEETAIAWCAAVFAAGTPSTDATLASLSISGVTLSPVFAAGTTSYTGTTTAEHSVVEAVPTDPGAVAIARLGGDAIPDNVAEWAAGSNTLTVTVYAADGETTETYTVTVTKS